jgi:hypothetical protein
MSHIMLENNLQCNISITYNMWNFTFELKSHVWMKGKINYMSQLQYAVAHHDDE